MILGALVLRGVERLRVSTVVGAVIVFIGVAYLSLT
jgi:drug/metabolite transporter (DMT)-like permease